MNNFVEVRNSDRSDRRIQRVKYCRSFFCRLRGLTFRRELPGGVGLLLDEGASSRLGTAIHMWGVWIPLGIAWLDDDLVVVDVRHALPWRLYFPAQPARYILEGDPSMLESLAVGEQLELVPLEENESIHY